MRIGRNRRRVVLQEKTFTRDAMGGEVITWVDRATVWSAVDPLRGREYLDAMQKQAEVTIRFTMRYRADVTQAWRVKWENKYYEIVEPIDVEGRHRELQIMARTQKNV